MIRLTDTAMVWVSILADKFGLSVSYQLIEERQGTAATPAMFLMELRISGKWCGSSGSEKLQAIGKTTREAKFKVAEAGLVRLKKLKPGLAFDLGFLPPDWESWMFENLERGGKPKKVMQTLREKGFSPANNALLMQKISARISSRRLRTKVRSIHSYPCYCIVLKAVCGNDNHRGRRRVVSTTRANPIVPGLPHLESVLVITRLLGHQSNQVLCHVVWTPNGCTGVSKRSQEALTDELSSKSL